MQCIILAAGKDKNSIEEIPKCLRAVGNKTVLDSLVDTFNNSFVADIYLVGGFEILQIMEKYPGLNYFYNEKWKDTKSLYSLSKAFIETNSDSLISYSDVVHSGKTLKLIQKDSINVFYDALWRTRYENRDLNNLEKVIDSKGRLLGEFSGLLYIPSKEHKRIKSLIHDLLEKDIKTTLLDLINRASQENYVNFINVAGNWAELDSVQDMSHFKFGTKAETLNNLKSNLKKSQILEQYTFTVGQYAANQKMITQGIQNNLSSKLVVVRSSALNEDTEKSSMAGNYESILKVDKSSVDALANAIGVVEKSYKKNSQAQNNNNQILVQPYLENVTMSGVVLSKNLQTSSPYYTVNYDESNNTESVTSGSGDSLNTFICYNNFTSTIQNEKLSALIGAIKEIEGVTKYDAIDVEFAFVGKQLYILQVRPIAAKKASTVVNSESILAEINNIKERLKVKGVNLLGCKKAYGVMPDWNPAEIIGTNPKTLSFDLYRYLITDNVWAQSRAFLGYKNTNNSGLVSLGGKPYVDIQMSFNTFIPDELSDELGAKLVDYFIYKLEKNPQNHDKVEFLVAITAYDFAFDEKVEDLLNNGFNEIECKKILSAYKNLTQNIITEQALSISTEIDKTLSLTQRRNKVLSSNLNDIDKIYHLLEDCKQYGTLPFANLARCGFIGSILLKSLLDKEVVKESEYSAFFQSIHTVAKEFMDDFFALSKKQHSKESFIERYGHLRPGTYDIASKSYKDGFDDYIDLDAELSAPITSHNFEFSGIVKERVGHEIAKSNLNFDVEVFIQFIIKSTEAREKSKFEFTKSLSAALNLIIAIGQEYGLSTNDLSHLDLEVLLKYRNSSSRLNFESELIDSIEKNKSTHLITCSLQLPALIFNPADVEMFHYPAMTPNFITHHNITAGAVFLTSGNYKNIDNKIVCIENADPGFDWIFCHNIKGLITKYGGIASHMSIRCAEFDLPAAIGCGNKIFNSVAKSNKVNLDCGNKIIRGI